MPFPAQLEQRSSVDTLALSRDAYFYHLLSIWSSIRSLRDQLTHELLGVQDRTELSGEEKTVVTKSVGALSTVLGLESVEGALTNIEDLLASFYHPHRPEEPAGEEQAHTAVTEELQAYDEQLTLLSFYSDVLSQFLNLRETIRQTADNIARLFPRNGNYPADYRSTGQELFDAMNGLHTAMMYDVNQLLTNAPKLIASMTQQIEKKKQELILR